VAIERHEWSPALHGLRGLSALLVVVSHLGEADLHLGPIPHTGIGIIGVYLFFAHSAYLLSSRLADDMRARHAPLAISTYLVRRVCRIYPLFFAVLLAHFAIGNIDARSVVRHLALTEGWRELWAIPVEFHFYLVVPLFVLVAAADRRLALLATAAFGVWSFAYGLAHPFFFRADPLAVIPRLMPFMLGTALGLAVPREAFTRRSGVTLVVAAGVCVVLAAASHVLSATTSPTAWHWLAMALFAALVLFWARCPGAIQSMLRWRPFVWLGEVSFSLYLTHMFVIVGFAGATGYASSWLALVACLPLAWLCYTTIERPGMYVGRILGEWLSGAHSPSAAYAPHSIAHRS
jgi:peptidoglycan/LPS O-acetylase OafA/YrhL